MATTSPDNLYSPDSVNPYNLTVDLAAMQTSVQLALTNRRPSYIPLTRAQRLALTGGDLFNGLLVYETDTGLIYLRDATTWSIVTGKTPIAVYRRTNTALNLGNSTYGNISATAAWTATYDVARGFAAYSDGLTTTVPGEYEIFWNLWLNGSVSGLAGIAINAVGTPGGDALHGIGQINFQTIALGSSTARVKLAAGDKLTLWGYGAGGGHAVRGATVLEPMHWGARWIAP